MRLAAGLPARLRGPLGSAGRRLFAGVVGPLQPAAAPGTVVAICHCHHPELVAELADRLLALPRGAELHVSSSDDRVFAAWEPYRARSRAPVRFHAVENRGRDILPFLTVARGLDLRPDSAVLKVHGKRSAYVEGGDRWRRDTLRGLFPGPFAAARAAARFAADPRLALIGAPGSFIAHPVYWGGNREAVAALMREMAGMETREEDLGFIAGTMFWIRGGFLAGLLPHLAPERFEPEPLGRDGSHAHAVERAIGMAALAWGWRVGETDRPDPLTRDAVRHRKVSYL